MIRWKKWRQAVAINSLSKLNRFKQYVPQIQQRYHIFRYLGGVSKYQNTLRTQQKMKPYNSVEIQKFQIKKEFHNRYNNKSICSTPLVCFFRSLSQTLSIWHLLRKIGVPHPYIISYRRWAKRFSHPWLVYSVPTALAVGIGDIIQQILEEKYHPRKIRDGHGQIVKVRSKFLLDNFDYTRNIKLMLIGFFVLGPMLSRWNSLITRRIGFALANDYLIKKSTFDVLLFAPIATLVCLSVFDFERIHASYPNIGPVWNGGLKKAFLDIITFNLMTRVLMNFAICLLVASCLRKLVRRPYEILFFTYVSSVLFKHNIGNVRLSKFPPNPKAKPRPKCRRFRDKKDDK